MKSMRQTKTWTGWRRAPGSRSMSQINCWPIAVKISMLKKSSLGKEFRPVALNAKANIDIKQQLRSFKSHNVIGKLDGSDPKLRDEYVIYTAHWDHLGLNHNLQGDQIYNGAVD